MVDLFNPRQTAWEEHFQFDDATAELHGLTRVGRATIVRLQMNRPAQLAARKQWILLKLFPDSVD
jgi:hypothetical protein